MQTPTFMSTPNPAQALSWTLRGWMSGSSLKQGLQLHAARAAPVEGTGRCLNLTESTNIYFYVYNYEYQFSVSINGMHTSVALTTYVRIHTYLRFSRWTWLRT